MAAADATDPAHRATVSDRDAALERGEILVTTDYVVDETLTLLRKRLGLHVAEAWWRQVEASHRVRWEWIGVERCDKARELMFRFADQDFSFTDCTSFVVMRELKLSRALTTDGHFRRMGFVVSPATA